MPMEKRVFKVDKIIKENGDTLTFRLVPTDGKPVSFIAGHTMNFHLLDANKNFGMFRAYSIASSPTTPWVDLTIKMEGYFPVNHLVNLKEGDHVGLNGPYGLFVLNEGEMKEVAMLAGGTGVTPFMSMIRYAKDKKLDSKLTLLYSCRQANDFLFFNEIKEAARENPNFKTIFTVTREEPADWAGECCRIDDVIIKKHVPNYANTTFFICGPAAFVKDLSDMLKTKLGLPPKQVKIEAWG